VPILHALVRQKVEADETEANPDRLHGRNLLAQKDKSRKGHQNVTNQIPHEIHDDHRLDFQGLKENPRVRRINKSRNNHHPEREDLFRHPLGNRHHDHIHERQHGAVSQNVPANHLPSEPCYFIRAKN